MATDLDFNLVTRFCDTCHKPAYALITEGEEVRLVQSGRTLIHTKAGSHLTFKIKCPDGHKNEVKIGMKSDA
jgi:hypothetical protein